MKFKKILLSLFIIIAFINISCGGFGFRYQKQINDKIYLIATDVMEQMTLSYKVSENSYVGLIDETVFEVQYDSNFIIVKQHPQNEQNEIIRDLTYYYIIDLKSRNDPTTKPERLSYKDFLNEKERLNLSNSLEFLISFKELQ